MCLSWSLSCACIPSLGPCSGSDTKTENSYLVCAAHGCSLRTLKFGPVAATGQRCTPLRPSLSCPVLPALLTPALAPQAPRLQPYAPDHHCAAGVCGHHHLQRAVPGGHWGRPAQHQAAQHLPAGMRRPGNWGECQGVCALLASLEQLWHAAQATKLPGWVAASVRLPVALEKRCLRNGALRITLLKELMPMRFNSCMPRCPLSHHDAMSVGTDRHDGDCVLVRQGQGADTRAHPGWYTQQQHTVAWVVCFWQPGGAVWESCSYRPVAGWAMPALSV